MGTIILDFGSGNTCKNDKNYVKRMIDELVAIDTKQHEIIIKWQLFEKAGNNIPLSHEIFHYAFKYANDLGYKTTSSVFDRPSLDFLLGYERQGYDIPFVKIANNRSLDYLIGDVPRKIPTILSVGSEKGWFFSKKHAKDRLLLCVSEYPTTLEAYEKAFGDVSYYIKAFKCGISDHTTDFELYEKYQPNLIEWHYCLDDSTGLDSGEFARRPSQLKEIL